MPRPVHARAESFGPAAEAYERGRPGWPPEAIDVAVRRLGLSPSSEVLDLAAGTGKLTRELVGRFASVIAVEPLDGMRAVLERVVPGARALAGTAEAIPLPGAAVDAVFVGEAFHWFDLERAVPEMRRVLKPGGGIAVLYNRRDHFEGDAWERETHAVFEAHMLPLDGVDPHDERAWKAALAPIHEDVVETSERMDADRILAVYASFSRLAALPADRRKAALDEIHDVLVRHAVEQVEIGYCTTIVTTAPADGTSRTRT